ncbi:MAG: heme-binding protein [Methylococcales bacterium]|nr:heme-binding protein [Methylococcales bacterium]MDD5632591.1 heme-binding protein [Methylococcales bacterium]
MHVTFEQAERAIEAAIREAKKTGTRMCIAVVDSGADLKAFVRMDDAWVGSVDIAIKKAKTACFFGMNTGQIGALSQPGGPLFGIEHSNDGLITFPGGVPVVDENGVLIGAVGVSGSSVENDHQVAKAGVEVIGVSDLPAHPWRT